MKPFPSMNGLKLGGASGARLPTGIFFDRKTAQPPKPGYDDITEDDARGNAEALKKFRELGLMI